MSGQQDQTTTHNNRRPIKKEYQLDSEVVVGHLKDGVVEVLLKSKLFTALALLGFLGLLYIVVFHHHLIVIHVHPASWCAQEMAKSEQAKDQATLLHIAPFLADACQGYNQAKPYEWMAKVPTTAPLLPSAEHEEMKKNGHKEGDISQFKDAMSTLCKLAFKEFSTKQGDADTNSTSKLWQETFAKLKSTAVSAAAGSAKV